MINKDTLNRMIPEVIYTPDLKELKRMVKEFIRIYYGEKKRFRKSRQGKFGTIYHTVQGKRTLTDVFKLFKLKESNKSTQIPFNKIFKYLNRNYDSKHKLRDVYIFKLKYDGYTFPEIVEITSISISRVKQIYYEIRKLVDNNF